MFIIWGDRLMTKGVKYQQRFYTTLFTDVSFHKTRKMKIEKEGYSKVQE